LPRSSAGRGWAASVRAIHSATLPRPLNAACEPPFNEAASWAAARRAERAAPAIRAAEVTKRAPVATAGEEHSEGESRPTVESLSPLDINDLNRIGAFSGHSMTTFYKGLRTSRRLVEYRNSRWPKDRPPQRIPIQWTRCNYGGVRPWFICPCGRRVARLYWGLTTIYRCRHCKEAIYASQRKGPKGRLHLKARRIRWRLGDDGRPGIDPLPPRRWRMHRKTHRRLVARLQVIERQLVNGARVYRPRPRTDQLY
jgi:hypothetical protein